MLSSLLVFLSMNTIVKTFFLDSEIPEIPKCCSENDIFDMAQRNCRKKPPDYTNNSRLEITLISLESNNYRLAKEYLLESIHLPQGCDSSDLEFSINIPGEVIENAEWFLVKENLESTSVYLTKETEYLNSSYCFEETYLNETYKGSTIVYCPLTLAVKCNGFICVQSTCPSMFVYNEEEENCKYSNSSENRWRPSIKDSEASLKYLLSSLNCESAHRLDYSPSFTLFPDGSMKIGNHLYSMEDYAVTHIEFRSSNTTEQNYEYKTEITACLVNQYEGYYSAEKQNLAYLLISFHILSMIFLLFLFIYLFQKNRHKLFGIVSLNMISNLFFFYLFLVIPNIFKDTLVRSYPTLCIIMGFGIQFCYLAAIFWLNIMCFDIWSTFRRIRRATENEPQGIRKPIFKWYCLYAWGIPAFITFITILISILPIDRERSILIFPDIGRRKCFFDTDLATLLYFHIVNGPIIILNAFFFLGSMWNLLCGIWAKKNNDLMNKSVSEKQNQTRQKTVVKLFFAMGFSWIAEIISWITLWIYGHNNRVVWVTSAFFDMINALQGVFIFLVLYLDAKRIKKIRNYLNCFAKNRCQLLSSSKYSNTLTTSLETKQQEEKYRLNKI